MPWRTWSCRALRQALCQACQGAVPALHSRSQRAPMLCSLSAGTLQGLHTPRCALVTHASSRTRCHCRHCWWQADLRIRGP